MTRYIINLIVVAGCTYLITFFGEEKRWVLLVIPIAVLGVQSAVNFWLISRESNALALLLKLLHDELALSKDQEVRLTLLSPNRLTRNFRQIARYSLFQPELTNHKFHIDKGVAGLARRNKRPEFLRLDGNFHKKIRETLGFTEEESRAFSQKAEYFCIPVFDEHRFVKFVLCLDSNFHDVITDSHRQRIICLMKYLAPLIMRAYSDEALVQ